MMLHVKYLAIKSGLHHFSNILAQILLGIELTQIQVSPNSN
jgi:hypothetical protein